VFLLSQMIHNQEVNNDLTSRGIKFIMDTDGKQYIPWDELHADDIVIIPAFGTTVEIEKKLTERGIAVERYDTTCPFVEKVWNRSEKLAGTGFTTIIHGKPNHEETRATFSRSAQAGPVIVVTDMKEAMVLAGYILGEKSRDQFAGDFAGRSTGAFDSELDLIRVGVVNQTTMLATETQAIAEFFKQVMAKKYGEENLATHFADTRDTLCYATNDNQDSTYKLLETDADLVVVVGGYNSSNTSHIVELCERKFPTYFINSSREIISPETIQHFDFVTRTLRQTTPYLPEKNPTGIILTSGASCPDTVVDEVLQKLLGYFPHTRDIRDVLLDMGVKPD
jgi:4-hydroxy-3-methylbut-2-en-1-yl diphosphate reductase